MVRRLLMRLISRHIEADTVRLLRAHGPDALFIVRKAAIAAREGNSNGHWGRVLARVEKRVPYRPY